MGPLALPLTIAGAGLSAVSNLYAGSEAEAQGKAQQQANEFEAQQLDVNAGQEIASSQRTAIEDRRQARLAQSTIRARAAASGGGADDPTVLNLEANAAGEGEYQALTDLYEGASRARGLRMQASADRFEGKQYALAGKRARSGSYFSAATSLFGGVGQGLMAKYG